MKNNFTKVLHFFAILLLIGLTGCGSSPVVVARGFMRALTSGNAGKTLDFICTTDTLAVIAVDLDWSDDYYQVISSSNSDAQVRVTGKIKMTVENMQQFVEDYKDVLGDQLVEKLQQSLPRMGIGAQVGVDFDYLALGRYHGRWCVRGSSYNALIGYLGGKIVEQSNP